MMHTNKPAYLPWLIWTLGCLFYFYECLLQVSLGVMSHELMQDFALTSHTLGILSGIYFCAYAIMQLPAGVLMDYFGPQRLLTIATLLCALGTIAFGYTHSFFMACMARLFVGLGSAFAAVGTMKLAANWFSANRFAMLTGLMVTIGMLGAIGGEAPLALLIDRVGWRESLFIMGIFGIVLALLILVVVKDTPQSRAFTTANTLDEPPLWASFLKILKNKQLWLVALYGGLVYMSTPVFCGLWGVPFLMLKLGISKASAANAIAVVFVGWAVASPLWGAFSNRIGRRKPTLYVAAFGSLITLSAILYLPGIGHVQTAILLFIFGVTSSAFLPAFAVTKELCHTRYVATGLSFMNMMNMIGISAMQPLIGSILDHQWNGKLAGAVHVYTYSSYQVALSLLPACILLSLCILPFIRETYCHALDDKKH